MSNSFKIICRIERTNSVGHKCLVTKPFYLTEDMANKIVFNGDNIDMSSFINNFSVENDCKIL